MTELRINKEALISFATKLQVRKENACLSNDSIAEAFMSGALAVIQEFIKEVNFSDKERGELPC